MKPIHVFRKAAPCYRRAMPADRPPPQQARAAAKRTAILDAAERLLADTTPAALTTTAIAVAAGVPVGSVYRYFANKDALLASLFARMNAGTAEALSRTTERPEDWRKALRRIGGVVRAMHDRHPGYGALMVHLQAQAVEGERIPALLAAKLAREAGLPEARASLVAETVVALFEAMERRHFALSPSRQDEAWDEGMIAVEAYLATVL